ncbi:ATP-dependent helicase HrpB [Cytophaga aurantiaca]|uniref:ATP-dependent helicase HrpB n=1 Tax=Cytophaga aurantiaca TaxID=29530 RepID=UPI00036FDA05|nr:ATP-dependent helicase HrpB [Cytophaga aurantiaca]
MKYTIPTTSLPVQEIVTQVTDHFKNNITLIVKAPPGAGKSTLLPLTFLNEQWLTDKKIIVLEPRRLAAKTIATRMSHLLGEQVGETIGYRIRFETKVSDKTRIEVVTEGILTRMLQTDNELKDVALVIFDEFHERSIHADVALALCREAQLTKRNDLRLLIMSATMDLPELSAKLACKIIESEGRQYPVAIHYMGATDMHLLPELTARVVKKASKDNKGDILVFLPGQAEINGCKELLEGKLKDTVIHTLYGQLPFAQQQAALLPDQDGKRKIVLATSIAETSLTIEGVTTVVDSGFGKRSMFDPESGLSRLETINISIDAADQRAGRAGRLSAGTCYRMWSEAQHATLQKHHQPEIETTDLSPLVLEMAIWGISNVFNMVWLTPPPKSHVKQARETLHYINALDRNKVTAHGKKIHQLPCNPRIAHMLLMAEELEQEALATDLAATLEEKDPLNAKEAGIDINERIKALRRFRRNDGKGRTFGLIERVAKSYRELMEIEVENETFDPYMSGLLLAYAYPERVAFARPGNKAQFQLANGTYAEFSHKDSLSRESWLSVGRIDAREGTGKIFSALPLNPKDLKGMVKTVLSVQWDLITNDLIVHTELRIGHIVLKSSPMDEPSDEERARALCNIVKKEGQHLLNFTPEFEQWQASMFEAQQQNPLAKFPDVDTDSLLLSCEEWLTPFADEIEEKDDLKKLDLLEIISARIPKELLKLVKEAV